MSKKSVKETGWRAERRAARARKYEMQTMSALSFERAFEGVIVGDAYDNNAPMTSKAAVLSKTRRH